MGFLASGHCRVPRDNVVCISWMCLGHPTERYRTVGGQGKMFAISQIYKSSNYFCVSEHSAFFKVVLIFFICPISKKEYFVGEGHCHCDLQNATVYILGHTSGVALPREPTDSSFLFMLNSGSMFSLHSCHILRSNVHSSQLNHNHLTFPFATSFDIVPFIVWFIWLQTNYRNCIYFFGGGGGLVANWLLVEKLMVAGN